MEAGLVGRARELDALKAWADEARAELPRIALVEGEAGIGKSRLVAALVEHTDAAGSRSVLGRTTELAGAPAYWPWLQVLEQLGERQLLEAAAGVDPESERFARFEAVTATIASAARHQALVVVLEDMHRADEASLRLLAHVAGRLAHESLLLVVTHRSTPLDQVPQLSAVVDEIARLPASRRMHLTGLDPDAVAEMLGVTVPDAVVNRVTADSGGNPLLVCEVARHLAAGGDPNAVPRSVRDAIAARMVSRSENCIEVVRVAAIIGRTFNAGLVATATNRPALACLDDLAEAVAAGFVEPTGRAGEFRFVHALVRDAVESTLGAAELSVLHRAVADAIETYDGGGDAQASELARHWDAASVLGERATAARWCERAAEVADRQLAWEEAARLFERALELGGDSDDPLQRYSRAIGAARARLHCDEITVCVERCVQAAVAARAAGRADLLAEATLVPEGRAVPVSMLRDLTIEALATLPLDDHARRARLHGSLTNIAFYGDVTAMSWHCEQAEIEAGQAGDREADLAAIRARQMVLLAPEHAAERLALAARLGDAARSVGRPSVALWEPLWRIDALVELGRITEAVATLPMLRRCAVAAGSPIARWHVARTEAALAQATGRFADSLEHAQDARRLFAQLESVLGAEAMYLGVRNALAMHAGWNLELAEAWDAIDLSQAPPFLGELPLMGPAMCRAHIGDVAQARRLYDRLSPAVGWQPPTSIWIYMHSLRIRLAIALGVLDDLPPLLAAIAAHRGLHVGSGGSVVAYEGPVELWLGVGAAALGQWDDADRDLDTASEIARASGTPAFAVHADVERATALIARSARGDTDEARRLLHAARSEATRLGMPDFLRRIDELAAGIEPHSGPLSARELEVAELVARGHTNKEIAATLYLSERTAQNHVQHILTKLDLTNRTQVAAWHREQQHR